MTSRISSPDLEKPKGQLLYVYTMKAHWAHLRRGKNDIFRELTRKFRKYTRNFREFTRNFRE